MRGNANTIEEIEYGLSKKCIGCDTDDDKINVVELDLKDKGIVCENCMLLYRRVENVVSWIPRCKCGKFVTGVDGRVCDDCKKRIASSLSCHFCMGDATCPHYHIVGAGTYPIIICEECEEIKTYSFQGKVNLVRCDKFCLYDV